VTTRPTALNLPSSRESKAPARNGAGSQDPKLAGVYYTPPRLAGLLASWALERDPERILEPSYGQGVFLREVDAKLRERGIHDPGRRIFGVELDPRAPAKLRESGLRLPEGHLHSGDLLSLDPGALGGKFDAIVGNPPYIRHHLLSEKLVARGRKSAELLGITLNGRSDAWAYFCAHLMTFLSEDGRLALVLPGSVLQADYAKPLLKALALDNGEVQLIRISERLFPGVQERTVLLLIDRARPTRNRVIHRSIADLTGLRPALKRRLRSASERGSGGSSGITRLPWRLSTKEAAVWEQACAHEAVSSLGELAKIRIGVVTGANSFFVRSLSEAEALGKRVKSVPIVSRGAWIRAPRWRLTAQVKVEGEPSRLLLFPEIIAGLSKRAQDEIASAEEKGLHLRHHCSKRSPWYSILDFETPDLLLPYMASDPPCLAINEAEATCTNTVHRVWLHQDAETSTEALAASAWTTLYRLSAELVGRAYGGGVLKLEPSGANALRVVRRVPSELLAEIESAAAGNPTEARRVADRRLLMGELGLSADEVRILGQAADRMARLRRR
jgi:adenine-specific DNA-methyltransferase